MTPQTKRPHQLSAEAAPVLILELVANKSYHKVPPPSSYANKKKGPPTPRRADYPPLLEILMTIFYVLMAANELELPPVRTSFPAHLDASQYCQYHRSLGHTLDTCIIFRDLVYDWYEQGRLDWAAIAEIKKNLNV